MNLFETYTSYLALKQHFTTESYDYFKYGGKVSASVNAFNKRKDKYFFYKISKLKEPELHILATFVYKSPKLWIGELIKDDSSYTSFKSMQESFTYNFQQDISILDNNFNENILTKDGQHPLLLKLMIGGKIKIESVLALDEFCKFIEYWNENIEDNVVWPEYYMKLKKYKPFFKIHFQYDEKRLKEILKTKFKDNQALTPQG